MRATIADRIERARKAKGLDRRELAERSGLSEAYLLRLERGEERPAVVVLEKVAAALEAPLVTLVAPPRGSEAAGDGARGPAMEMASQGTSGGAENGLSHLMDEIEGLRSFLYRLVDEVDGRLDHPDIERLSIVIDHRINAYMRSRCRLQRKGPREDTKG